MTEYEWKMLGMAVRAEQREKEKQEKKARERRNLSVFIVVLIAAYFLVPVLLSTFFPSGF